MILNQSIIRCLPTLLVILGVASLPLIGYTQSQRSDNEKAILGNWLNSDKTREVNFYKVKDKYFGVIVSAPPEGRVKAGDIIFESLEWTGRAFEGTIETPRGTANCTVVIVNENTMAIKAEKGFASRKVYWTRSK